MPRLPGNRPSQTMRHPPGYWARPSPPDAVTAGLDGWDAITLWGQYQWLFCQKVQALQGLSYRAEM